MIPVHPEQRLQRTSLRHVGIIMDGNGRWATAKGQRRFQGHLEGLKAAKRIVNAAVNMGVSYLTLYTFSTENWKRSAEEIGFLMDLVKRYLREELGFCMKNRMRVRHAGNREGLAEDVLSELDRVCGETKNADGLQVILALNYGGRDEIVRAVRKYLAEAKKTNETINEKALTAEGLSSFMDNPDVPDPDLIIRTAGEFRTSNFLLWEGAYAEYYISGKLWPDWTEADLADAVKFYENRDRRFGSVTE